jgi:molybdate/tungstate transport system ATP-binding protein
MIRLESVSIEAGAFALRDVSFTVPTGSYAVLMGNTGGGKTTLLEVICGLREPSSGRVLLEDRDVTELAPGSRGLGYVPQDGALFPAMRVRDQLGFALRIRRTDPAEITRRVDELGTQLGITPLLDRWPEGLSGGERQRVALGRALAARPRVLLLDEPLSALDEERRDSLADLLATVHRATGITVLHVTHHRAEAARVATLLLRLVDGRVQSEPQ